MAKSKGKVGKKKSVAKNKGKSVSSNVRSRLAERAEKDRERVSGGGTSDYITLGNKGFEFKGASLGNEFLAVILDFSYLNEWFDRKFDPENPSNPACFAISMDGPKVEDMVPHEESPLPQNDNCADCDLNQWGTAEMGKGKACGNKKRLALIPADPESLEDLEGAELAFHRCGVNTASHFEKYKKGVDKLHKSPVCAVITRIYKDDDFEQAVANFETIEIIDDDAVLDVILDRAESESVMDILMESYDKTLFEPLKKGSSGKKSSKKKAAKKKAAKKKGSKSKFS